MSVQRDTLNELRRISEMCHDMLCKVNKGLATDCEVISLIFNIRENAASKYNNGAKELGWHNNDFDLIAEMNKEKLI